MRATLMSEAAVPARPSRTAPTASAISGPVSSPIPIPVSPSPISASHSGRPPVVAANTASPSAMSAVPATISRRAPNRGASRPVAGETRKNSPAQGSSATPAPAGESTPCPSHSSGTRKIMP